MRAIVTEPELDDQGKMLRFWRKGEPPAIGNAELMRLNRTSAGWQYQSA